MSDLSISLNKYISQTGVCSRREADKWIEEGKVKINGHVATKGNRVEPNDTVTMDGRQIKNKVKPVYIAFNKPPGITCTTDIKEKDNIISYIDYPERIFPIGRLDKPSSGLIFLTNDGDMVNKILRVENNHEKEYIVSVNKPITKQFIDGMSNGVVILGTKTRRCKVERLGNQLFKITLTQGLNRQIRRMCEHFDYRVITLKRIRIMNVIVDGIKQGQWRYLTKDELRLIKQSVGSA